MNHSFNFSIHLSFSLTTPTTMSFNIALRKLNPAPSTPLLSNSANNRQRMATLFIRSVPHILSLPFIFACFSKNHKLRIIIIWLTIGFASCSIPTDPSAGTLRMIASDTDSNHSEKLPMLYLFPFPHLCYPRPTGKFLWIYLDRTRNCKRIIKCIRDKGYLVTTIPTIEREHKPL